MPRSTGQHHRLAPGIDPSGLGLTLAEPQFRGVAFLRFGGLKHHARVVLPGHAERGHGKVRVFEVVGHAVQGIGLNVRRWGRLFAPKAYRVWRGMVRALDALDSLGQAHERQRHAAHGAALGVDPGEHLHGIARAGAVTRIGNGAHDLPGHRWRAQHVVGVAVRHVPFAGAVFGDDGQRRVRQAGGGIGCRVGEREDFARRRHLACSDGPSLL